MGEVIRKLLKIWNNEMAMYCILTFFIGIPAMFIGLAAAMSSDKELSTLCAKWIATYLFLISYRPLLRLWREL